MAATFDPRTAPTVTFNARNAEAYETGDGPMKPPAGAAADPVRRAGRWRRVLDVGCGTGSLTFTLPQIANIAAVGLPQKWGVRR